MQMLSQNDFTESYVAAPFAKFQKALTGERIYDIMPKRLLSNETIKKKNRTQEIRQRKKEECAMNYENLHELINRYEQNVAFYNNAGNEENFKWEAVQTFQRVWFSSQAHDLSFAELFRLATKDSSVLVNNQYIYPTSGVVKLASVSDATEQEVRHLFVDVLFAEDGGDLNLRQCNMDLFVEGFNKLLYQYFPTSYKYKQDRHAASCYLAMYAPDQNYIYKYSSAEAFAVYTEFGKNLGSGSTFSLANYYELCDLIVKALQEHPTLLDKHAALLEEKHYKTAGKQDCLQLLAFDIIYCSSAYPSFAGLTHKPKAESICKYEEEQQNRKKEEERLAEIAAKEQQILQLECELDVYRAISLMGIQVTDKKLGIGTVISHKVDQICVAFADAQKNYCLNTKYIWRPKFEDDEQLILAMMEYAAKIKEMEKLQKELQEL